MPEFSYQKPKNKTIKVFRGKELETLVHTALQSLFAKHRLPISQRKAQDFLYILPRPIGRGQVIVIIEQYPLHSQKAQGKFKNELFQFVEKTQYQYSRPFVKASNPRTPKQQKQRAKMTGGPQAWRNLPQKQKDIWNKKAKKYGKTGYILFISNYLSSQ